jgi:Skp family chaperone for outer membrane proteins
MPLITLLDADTETFETGAYQRAVRVRKWVYLLAGAVVVLSHGWFKNSDILGWVGVSDVPALVIWQVLTLALAYFCVQYALVIAQVATVYMDILEERFAGWSKAKLKELLDKFKELNKEQQEDARQFERDEAERGARELIAARASDLQTEDLERELRAARAKVLKTANDVRDKERSAIQAEVDKIMKSDIRSKPTVVMPEVVMDAIRLLPPLIAGLWVLFRYGTLPLG